VGPSPDEYRDNQGNSSSATHEVHDDLYRWTGARCPGVLKQAPGVGLELSWRCSGRYAHTARGRLRPSVI